MLGCQDLRSLFVKEYHHMDPPGAGPSATRRSVRSCICFCRIPFGALFSCSETLPDRRSWIGPGSSALCPRGSDRRHPPRAGLCARYVSEVRGRSRSLCLGGRFLRGGNRKKEDAIRRTRRETPQAPRGKFPLKGGTSLNSRYRRITASRPGRISSWCRGCSRPAKWSARLARQHFARRLRRGRRYIARRTSRCRTAASSGRWHRRVC